MRDFLRLISIVLCFGWVRNIQFDELTAGVSICAGPTVAASEPVKNFCRDVGGMMLHRCCRSSDNHTFLAIDLTNASLTEIPIFRTVSNLKLTVADLRNNPQLQSSPHDNAFVALTSLNELFLPTEVPCPGESLAWEHIHNTTDIPGFNCTTQMNICLNDTSLCTETGTICFPNGPNNYVCNCTGDYYGYKCLRHGSFPYGAFFGTTLSLTVVASALLFWTQRRHVKKVK